MAVFLHNLGLDFMACEGELLDAYLKPLFHRAEIREAHGGYYATALLESGAEFIFHALPDGEDLNVIHVDIHMKGACIWKGHPFFMLDDESNPLSATIAFSNSDETGVYVAHVMHAATLDTIDTSTPIEMQITSFPLSMALFDTREAYEEAGRGGDGSLLVIGDGRILPLNFMLKHDPSATQAQKDGVGREDLMLVCGTILDDVILNHRFEGQEQAECHKATIQTQLGHLDVIYNSDMLEGAVCKRGQYLAMSAVFSADVIKEHITGERSNET